MVAHSVRSGMWQISPSRRTTASASPSRSSIRGTSYSSGAVRLAMAFSLGMLQNREIFSRMSWGMASPHRHRITSGWMPRLSSSLAECWVGLLFSSPVPGMDTISDTWMNITLCRPRSWATCRMASRKGWDSMSPTVPPISTMATSASGTSRA